MDPVSGQAGTPETHHSYISSYCIKAVWHVPMEVQIKGNIIQHVHTVDVL